MRKAAFRGIEAAFHIKGNFNEAFLGRPTKAHLQRDDAFKPNPCTGGAPALLDETDDVYPPAPPKSPRKRGSGYHLNAAEYQIPAFAGISAVVGICLASAKVFRWPFLPRGEVTEAMTRQASGPIST
jgi:hypothetical protein